LLFGEKQREPWVKEVRPSTSDRLTIRITPLPLLRGKGANV
jgi:hypothetical protein